MGTNPCRARRSRRCQRARSLVLIELSSFGAAISVFVGFVSLTFSTPVGHRAAIDSHLRAGVT
jgi:hypothetical protein